MQGKRTSEKETETIGGRTKRKETLKALMKRSLCQERNVACNVHDVNDFVRVAIKELEGVFDQLLVFLPLWNTHWEELLKLFEGHQGFVLGTDRERLLKVFC